MQAQIPGLTRGMLQVEKLVCGKLESSAIATVEFLRESHFHFFLIASGSNYYTIQPMSAVIVFWK